MEKKEKELRNNDKKTGKKIVDEYEGNSSFDDEERKNIYRSLALIVCSSNVKPDMLCSDGSSNFKPHPMLDLFNMVNPSIKLDAKTMTGYCLQLFEEEKAKIQQVLGSFDGQVCLSVDVLRNPEDYDTSCGSSNLRRDGCYMCVRVHFIDGNWKLRNYVLQYHQLGHLSPKAIILKCFQNFDIANKISVFMVHDTFDDNVRIIDILNSKIQEKEMPKINGQILRAPCCASVFRVMVEEAFQNIEEIIEQMRELDNYNKIYPCWHHKLQNIVSTLEEVDLTDEFDEFRLRFGRTSEEDEVTLEEELESAKDVCKLVGSVKKAAEVLYETKNATASLYLYNIQKLRAALIKESVSSNQFMKKMALNMLEKLYKYWKDAFMLLAFATVLDPRCKLKYIEFVLLKFEGDSGHYQLQLVHDAIHNLFSEYVTCYPVVDCLEVDSSSSDNDSIEEHDSDSDAEEEYHLREKEKEIHDNPAFGFDCLDEYNQFVQSNSQTHKSELELYLDEPVLPWKRNMSLLSYWRNASNKYPTLGRMAKDILSIPLSLSTNYEAYFTDFRPADTGVIRLKPNLRNALMCVRSWMDPKQVDTQFSELDASKASRH